MVSQREYQSRRMSCVLLRRAAVSDVHSNSPESADATLLASRPVSGLRKITIISTLGADVKSIGCTCISNLSPNSGRSQC